MIMPPRTAKIEDSTFGFSTSIVKYDFTIINRNAKITDNKITAVAFVRGETMFLSIVAPV